MNGINAKIDALEKQERIKKIRTTLFSVSMLALVIGILVVPPLGSSSQLEGTVIGHFGVPSDLGTTSYLKVELNSGEQIKVRISSPALFRKNQTVKLQKQEALLFGKPIYRFISYGNPHSRPASLS